VLRKKKGETSTRLLDNRISKIVSEGGREKGPGTSRKRETGFIDHVE